MSTGQCAHRRRIPVLLELREPWKSNWGDATFPTEDMLMPPMPGNGLSLYDFGQRCADCGIDLPPYVHDVSGDPDKDIPPPNYTIEDITQ